MKKFLQIVLLVILTLILSLAFACTNKPKELKVKFSLEDGTEISTLIVQKGCSVEIPENLNKVGHVYVIYNGNDVYSKDSIVNQDLNLTVKYAPKNYDVELIVKLGESYNVNAIFGQVIDDLESLPQEINYLFKGFFDEADGNGTKYIDENGTGIKEWDKDIENATLYAYMQEDPDTTDPIIKGTFAYEVNAGENLILDLTAEDDRDGDLTDNIAISETNGASFVEGLTIRYDISGSYNIKAVVTNASELFVEKTIEITVNDVNEETQIENNDINLLSYGVFYENFSKKDQSELIKGMEVVVVSTKDAINGTSLLFDTINSESVIHFENTKGKIIADKTYIVEFDIKLISGTGTNGFYVGTRSDELTQTNIQFDLSSMAINETKKIKAQITNKSDIGSYFISIFTYGENEKNGIYVIDNIKIFYKETIKDKLNNVGGKILEDFESYDGLDSNSLMGSIIHQGSGTITTAESTKTGGKALYIDNSISNGNNAHFSSSVLPNGCYRVSFDFIIESGAFTNITIQCGEKFHGGDYSAIRIPHNQSVTFTMDFEINDSSEIKYFVIWTGDIVMYVDNINIERIESKTMINATYYLTSCMDVGGQIIEDFETEYVGEDSNLGRIFCTYDKGINKEIENDSENHVMHWTNGQLMFFFTQNYIPNGQYKLSMKIKKATGDINLYILGVQVDASMISENWTTVEYTINIDNNPNFIFDSGVNPGMWIDDIVITRI